MSQSKYFYMESPGRSRGRVALDSRGWGPRLPGPGLGCRTELDPCATSGEFYSKATWQAVRAFQYEPRKGQCHWAAAWLTTVRDSKGRGSSRRLTLTVRVPQYALNRRGEVFKAR
eukprot:763182-Hanusia_phi.AAC.2